MPSPAASISRTGACQRCHRRKVRCDRTRPSCSPCARNNVPCTYAEREHQVQLRRQDVERLEQRIRRLEADNEALSSQLTSGGQDRVTNPSNSRRQESTTTASLNSNGTQAEDSDLTSPSSLLGLGLRQGHGQPSAPAGSGEIASQVIHLSLSAGGGRNFVGSTSGLLLANLLQPHGDSTTMPSHGPSSAQRSNMSTSRSNQRVSTSTSALPPRSVAVDILDAYCSHDRLQYPFLSPRALEVALETVYSADGPINECPTPFDCFIVHMAFAIGTSQARKLNWNGTWDAEMSYNRASAYLVEILADGGINALQAILLICQYRMGTPSHDTTASVWHLIGMAARMCFELGLHRASTYTLPTSADEHMSNLDGDVETKQESLEIKRRCFWTVVSMDRIASLVLGRPLAIQLDDIDADVPQADADAVAQTPPESVSNRSLSTAPFGTPEWHLSTSIFAHIVNYRIICGEILNALHRTTRHGRQQTINYESIRDDLANQLRLWYAKTSALPLIPVDQSTASPSDRSSFRSEEWYELLYHNGILMLFRPSPCLCDTSKNSTALQNIFTSSQKSLELYANLHRTGKINYTWVTLHAIFIAGLSYIYALRNHLQHLQSLDQPSATINGFSASLASTPTISQVVNDTRACSKVLVAVSERWAFARSCSEVFDKLSDAVVADVVDAQMRAVAVPHVPVPNSVASGTLGTGTNLTHMNTGPDLPHAGSEYGQTTMPNFANMTVDDTLRDCLGDIQSICYDQHHSDAIAQLSQDWLFGLGENPDRFF